MKPIDSPVIDPRNTEAVARQTAALAEQLSGWSPGDKADAGTALIGAFATMAQQVISRLNQMPNRHFLAYLHMLGLQPQPPRAAEVPLTFTPAVGARGVRVPAGTQVRGLRADGSSATFHTGEELELLPSREPVLWRAITYQPPGADGIDRASVDTAKATGREAGYYGLFSATDAVEHTVYLAADEVLTVVDVGDAAQLSITFSTSDDASAWQSLQQSGNLAWEYFSSDSNDWASLTPLINSSSVSISGNDFQFNFTRPPDMTSCALSAAPEATRARWIRVCLKAWPSDVIPAWCGVKISAANAVDVSELAPEKILFNGVPIDTSKDYYPLGQQPVFNDSCTIALGSLPSASDATLTVHVNISAANADPSTDDDPALAWEIGSGDTWTAASSDSWNAASPNFNPGDAGNDTAYVLKATGAVGISLPAALLGIGQLALRVRLSDGNYGTGITVSGGNVTDDGYRPPILQSIAVSATYTPSATPICVTDNGEGRQLESFAQPVMPFQCRDDQQPAFYLAFGESLGQASVSMYLEVSSLSGVTLSEVQFALQNTIDPVRVEWEYSAASTNPPGSTDWKTLQVEDGTLDFARSGFLRFIAPVDHARSAQFGSVPLYWLRARLRSGSYAVPPQGGLVLPNSVAASNARTIRDEVLGSSRQTPGQTFVLAHTPVLSDPELMVREPAPPSDDESAQLRAEFGPLAVVPASAGSGVDRTEDTANLGAAWVRWKQVGSFAASGPRDRHYTLDYQDGTVAFGDGRNGMVPPAGRSNVVMARYGAGGGTAGNLPAGAITQLVTAVAHVAGVDNRIASSGGADGEDSDAVMDWGPSTLRHRGRAAARQDYEDLVEEGFPQIAKVRALTPIFDPTAPPGSATGAGHVLVVVVPDTGGERPAPSVGLLQQIDDFLRSRMPPAVRLSLSGPDWLVVNVTVTVIAKRMSRGGGLKDEVQRALRRFLNPLSGGFDRGGWSIGQMVHDSDVTRYLLALPGVDSVSDLTVTRTPAVSRSGSPEDMSENTADQKLTVILVCSGSHTVTVQSAGSP